MSEGISVLLVDDHALVREALGSWLRSEEGIRVVGEVGSADEAVAMAVQHRPDVVMMDIDMPGLLSFEAARLIRSRSEKTRIVFLSAFSSDRYIEDALKAEASGYISKNQPPEAVAKAIRQVAAGGVYFSPEIQRRIVIESGGARLAKEGKTRVSTLTQREMDLAASVQVITEEVVLKLARGIARETGERNLCLAGGVALNCVANGKLLREKYFDRIWLQPAAGDAGGALGAALAAYYLHLKQPRTAATSGDAMQGSYLGPTYSQESIERSLTESGAKFEVLGSDEILSRCARDLAEGKALGWHQGRMEFGPRALGGRSILGDARSPTMQKLLNLKVKYRESFRPFAPSVLREDVSEWFDLDDDSPYMLLVADVQDRHRIRMTAEQERLFGIDKLNVPRSTVPAITHVDYSARVQTVHEQTNPRYHGLISRFKDLTGCPVIVNTSFNVRGEPIVCTPHDAFRCFMGTEIEVLAVGNCYLRKEVQSPELKQNYVDKFELD